MTDNSMDTMCTNGNSHTNYDYELTDDIILNLEILYAHDLYDHFH